MHAENHVVELNSWFGRCWMSCSVLIPDCGGVQKPAGRYAVAEKPKDIEQRKVDSETQC